MDSSRSPLTRLQFDDKNQPSISLPPPTSTRGHQRSRTTVDLPPLFSRGTSVSPTRSSTFLPFRKVSRAVSPEPAASVNTKSELDEAEVQHKPKTGTAGKIASWFDGSSEPVSISFVPSPRKERPEPFYKLEENMDSDMASQDNLTRRLPRRSSASPVQANGSRFSFFKRATPAPVKSDPDELVHMDITKALTPEPLEEVTPEVYDSLRHNAEALLKKFQSSYAENLGMLRQATSTKNIQTDELEAAETRNEHLKLQLLEMAERAAEQEKMITALRDELNKHQQSIRMITEDDAEPRGRWRRNRISDFSSSGDSMCESDMSSAVSVFSDGESVRTPATSIAPSPVMKNARLYNPMLRLGTTIHSHATPVLVPDCSNCHGVPASEAWDVIGMMKMESIGLKQRVSELENAQDAALDFLSGLNNL